MLEKLRKELHEYINSFGLNDPRTVKKSQELDIEIVKSMGGEISTAILDVKAAEQNFNLVNPEFIDVAIYNYNSAKSRLSALLKTNKAFEGR